ncbi:unnamed protein product [Nippostrongylus brasiliensis]|uniref:Uncharacterized protein n=1 Tax=Nippostrongylus brasiliensis TaxID=27835 RepID=A0A158R050_NIPBR|nr:unnamed protein product [Nippostrongylus brasiliensis]
MELKLRHILVEAEAAAANTGTGPAVALEIVIVRDGEGVAPGAGRAQDLVLLDILVVVTTNNAVDYLIYSARFCCICHAFVVRVRKEEGSYFSMASHRSSSDIVLG